jgi:hypothetical protein
MSPRLPLRGRLLYRVIVMRPALRTLRVAVLAALAPWGCAADRDGYTVVIDAEAVPGDSEPDRSIFVDAALGSPCAVQPPGGPFHGAIEEIHLTDEDSPLPVFEPVAPGVYGLVARAFTLPCEVVAWGCRDHELTAGGTGSIDVTLVPLEGGPTEGCERRAGTEVDRAVIATLYSPSWYASRPVRRPLSR